MNDHEKYLFDLRGYIAVENALSTEQLTALNQITVSYTHLTLPTSDLV